MRKRLLCTVLIALVAFTAAAKAQTNPLPDSIGVAADTVMPSSHSSIRSTIDTRSAMHRRAEAAPAAPIAMASSAGLGQSKALMIVGGAGLIAGAIIGGKPGTIIMVGGAVIGLYGLYQYLQ